MRRAVWLAPALCMAFAVGAFGGELKSGPEVGKNIPGPFHPLNINGSKAGEKACLV